jgi:Zn finger protein HypA/HybF involved in hydrogenase expression
MIEIGPKICPACRVVRGKRVYLRTYIMEENREYRQCPQCLWGTYRRAGDDPWPDMDDEKALTDIVCIHCPLCQGSLLRIIEYGSAMVIGRLRVVLRAICVQFACNYFSVLSGKINV